MYITLEVASSPKENKTRLLHYILLFWNIVEHYILLFLKHFEDYLLLIGSTACLVMCVYVCMYMYAYMGACIYARICMYVYIYIYISPCNIKCVYVHNTRCSK